MYLDRQHLFFVFHPLHRQTASEHRRKIRKLTKLLHIYFLYFHIHHRSCIYHALFQLSCFAIPSENTQNISLASSRTLHRKKNHLVWYKCMKISLETILSLLMIHWKNTESLSFSWDITYAYLLNISNDSNHYAVCILRFDFICLLWDATTTNTHIRMKILSCSVQPHRILSRLRTLIIVGIFIPPSENMCISGRRGERSHGKNTLWWLKNTRPVMAPPLLSPSQRTT